MMLSLSTKMALAKFVGSVSGLQHAALTLRRSRTLLYSSFTFSSDVKNKIVEPFDTRMLEILACPLSKKRLRYDEKNNELISDELGVAYPILDGIPHLNPQDGRMIKNKPGSGSSDAGNS